MLPVFNAVRVAHLLLLLRMYYFSILFMIVCFPCLVLSLHYIPLVIARILVPLITLNANMLNCWSNCTKFFNQQWKNNQKKTILSSTKKKQNVHKIKCYVPFSMNFFVFYIMFFLIVSVNLKLLFNFNLRKDALLI